MSYLVPSSQFQNKNIMHKKFLYWKHTKMLVPSPYLRKKLTRTMFIFDCILYWNCQISAIQNSCEAIKWIRGILEGCNITEIHAHTILISLILRLRCY
jgi:hypothetical protein